MHVGAGGVGGWVRGPHTSARRVARVAVYHGRPVAECHPVWQAHHIVAAQLRLTEELQRRRAHETEEAKGVEVVKNGAVRERYRWTQELPEVTVSVELPPGTAKGQVLCRIGMQSLVVGVRGLPPIMHGALHARVRPEDCLWQLQDSHRLLITLPKLSVAEHECSTGWQKSSRASARGHHAYSCCAPSPPCACLRAPVAHQAGSRALVAAAVMCGA